MKPALAIFEALSSPVRRRILAYLSQTDLSAGEIAARFNFSKPTVSRHLSVLENARLVSSRKQAQFVYYHLNREHLVSNMYDFLADFCPRSHVFKAESKAMAKAKRAKARGGSNV